MAWTPDGPQVGVGTGDPTQFESLRHSWTLRAPMRYFVDVKVRGNQIVERLYAAHMPAPFLSLLVDDCIARGRDYHDGGAATTRRTFKAWDSARSPTP